MFDSEYESEAVESRTSKSEKRITGASTIRSDSEAESAPRRGKAKTFKRKSNTRAPSKSDSEDDHSTKRDKTKTSKRKATTARAPSKHSKTGAEKRRHVKEEDPFGLVSEEERDVAHANKSRIEPAARLPSSLSSAVANGAVLRRAQLSGLYYAELRLYATRDALAARPETRYTKALVTLKLQLDPDRPEWDLLQKFLKRAKTTYFSDSAPVLYNNKSC